MDTVKLQIDKHSVEVPAGTTLLEAARTVGIQIPTLCYMKLPHLNIENHPGGCRICAVEVAGRKNLAPACSTVCTDGMTVTTNSVRVLNARKTVLGLILSDHPKDCLSCSKSGTCDLQRMAIRLGIRNIPEAGQSAKKNLPKDISQSIIRDMEKCIFCRRCERMCNRVQTVGALHAVNRGFDAVVLTAFGEPLQETTCTFCGQCVAVCPTGALTEFDHTVRLVRLLATPGVTVVVQTAPAVRAALGEEFGLPPGTLVTGKMVAALRELGFDKVFDTDFAADLTIMEEASELLDRLTRHLQGDPTARLPMLTSCCPAWVNFIETYYPDMLDVPSTARSPQQMFGAIANTYLAGKMGVDRKNMVVVSVMPCVAKKYECERQEFWTDGDPDVNFSITTRELAHLIREANLNFDELEDSDFDHPLGESTGAGVIFGTTGGVIEAAARTAYEWFTGETLAKVDFTALRGMEGLRVAEVDFGGTPIRIGIAHGLGNARRMLDQLRAGELDLHAIEIMACPGGCIGGGGQPLHHGDEAILAARQQAIYREDAGKPIRKSHENPFIKALYAEFLGKPLGEKSHRLLHTRYRWKRDRTMAPQYGYDAIPDVSD